MQSDLIDFESTVINYLNKTFINSCVLKCEDYQVGVVLNTRNPYRCTNATIVGVVGNGYQVLTDIGNVLLLKTSCLTKWYHLPIYRRPLIGESINSEDVLDIIDIFQEYERNLLLNET